MSVSPVSNSYSTSVVANNPATAASSGMVLGPESVQTRFSTFDQFQRSKTQGFPVVARWKKWVELARHPFQTARLNRMLTGFPGESKLDRIYQYLKIRQALGHEGRAHLKSLLKTGVLNDNKTDDQHTTLHHLYAMLTTRRAPGLSNVNLVNETVRILNKPFLITQKFAPLSENAARELLRLRNNPTQMRLRNAAIPTPTGQRLSWQDINVTNSATCVASSVMYYMADKCPAEITRQLNELTSPLQAFYEKVNLTELSPQDPQTAYQILQEHHIQYSPAGPGEVWVKVHMPDAALIRAANSNQKYPRVNVRTGIEAAYQSALTFLATRSYDPATDMRDSEIPGVLSKGLTEMEKTLMETIIKDNGGVASITYQVVAGKQNPTPEQESLPFLYGYTRTFEQTAADMVEALKMGEFVIIGITETDADGSIAIGHEITITSAFVDPNDRQLKFVVVDSDDDIPAPVVRSAKELIPKIHHAGMPLKLAEKIQTEVNETPGYYVTDQADVGRFDALPFVDEPLPPDALPNAATSPADEVPVQNAQKSYEAVTSPELPPSEQPPVLAQPILDWVPIPIYSPPVMPVYSYAPYASAYASQFQKVPYPASGFPSNYLHPQLMQQMQAHQIMPVSTSLPTSYLYPGLNTQAAPQQTPYYRQSA